jgi:hypothetical protein
MYDTGSSVAVQQSHQQQALDRDKSMTNLQGECTKRRAEYTEEEENEHVGRVLVPINPTMEKALIQRSRLRESMESPSS